MACGDCSIIEVTCNHNVTIGYLKQLVATMSSPITVVGNDNSYCPTYGELTGGTIIQRFSDGGSGAWSNNVDGITISGGYSNGQIVAKKDLKLIYTVLDSITVSNNSPIVTECGGSTTSTKTITFRKYVKDCDSEPTSTTQEDTTLSITWNGTDSPSSARNTFGRNESFSDEHASNVSCTAVWRGSSYTSNSITVKQNKRTPSSTQDVPDSSGTSLNVSCYPVSFGCEGGTSNASATYYYTTWTERRYIDTCGYEYDRENINVRNLSTDVSSSLNRTSYTFDACTEGSFTFSATYGGFSNTAVASETCSGCECIETGRTSSCSGVNVNCYAHSSVSTLYTQTIYYSNCDPSTSSYYVDVDVNIPCNSTTSTKTFTGYYQGNAFTIIQAAGNCCGPSCVCNDLTLSSASNGSSAAGRYTVATFSPYTNSCLTGFSASSSEGWLSDFSISNGTITAYASQNTGTSSRSTTVTLSYTADGSSCSKSVTFTQEGTSCEAYTCYYVSNASHSTVSSGTTSAYVTWSYTAFTQYQNCTTSTSTGTAGQTVYFDANAECSNITRSGTFYWNDHYSCDNRSVYCLVYWSVEQEGKGPDDPDCQACGCGQLSISEAPLTWSNCSDTSTAEVGYTINKSNCISIGSPSITGTGASHFDCAVNGTTRKFLIWPVASNTTSRNITATAILNYVTSDNENCSKSISLTHNAGTSCYCLCNVLRVSSTVLTWDNCSDSGSSKSQNVTVTISDGNCISNITTSITGSNASHFTGSYNNNTKTITIYPNNANDTSSDIDDATFVMSYNSGSKSCSQEIRLKHEAGTSCYCGKYSFSDAQSTVSSDGSGGVPIAFSDVNQPKLTLKSKSVDWVSSFSSGQFDPNRWAYGFDFAQNTGDERSGSAVLQSSEGCEFTATFTQQGAAPVEKTFTVYSDVEGASVTWGNGSTGTITGGTCTLTISGYDSLTATLSKNGVSFEHNGSSCSADGWVLITNAAQYVTINGVEWATKNLGQTSITGLGSTYEWGATTACPGGAWDSGYDITTDRSNHDIAYITSGGSACMPTQNDIGYIGTNVTDEYELTINGVDGVLFVDRNSGPTYGNSVYIPVGKYWTTDRKPQGGADAGLAEFLEILDDGATWNGNEEIDNCNLIRPIKYTAPACTCNDFTVTGNTSIGYSSQSTAVIGTYTVPSCTGSVGTPTVNVGWVSYLSCINGTVYGQVSGNTSASSRSGTLTLPWSGGGLSCTKTATFTQEGGTPPTPTVAYYLYGNFEVSCDGYNPNVQEMEQRLPYSAFTSNGTFISASTTEDTVDMGYPYIIGCYDGVDARVIRNSVTGATLDDAVPGIVQLTGSCDCLYTITYRLNYTSTSITATIVSIDGDANFDQSEMSKWVELSPNSDDDSPTCAQCDTQTATLSEIVNWKVGDVIYECRDSSMCSYTGLTITNDIDHLSIIQEAIVGCQKCFELGTHNGMFLLRANEYTETDVPSVLYYHGSENIELVYSAIRANNGVCFTLNSTGYRENTPYVLEIVNSNGELDYTDDEHEHEYGYVDDEYIIVYIAYMNQIQGGYSFNVNTYEPYTPHINDCA